MVAGYRQRKGNEWNYLENYSFFDWQPVNRFDKWSNVFMPVFMKKTFRCLVVNFFQPVHLITVAANEQRLAVVQPTENRTQYIKLMTSDLRRQETADS